FLAPLLEFPPPAGAGVESNERSAQVHTDLRQLSSSRLTLVVAERQAVPIPLAVAKPENVLHPRLVGACPLALEHIVRTHLEPGTRSLVGRRDEALRIQNVTDLLIGACDRQQARADLAGVHVDA